MDLVARSLVFETTQSVFTFQYYAIASITILYYDHLTTFPTEVQRVWQRRLTLSSVLFLLNRYITFLGYFPILYMSFHPPNNMTFCRNFVRFGGYLSLFTQVIIAIVFSLRAYALYNRRTLFIVFTAVLGLATVITSAWSLTEFYGLLLNFELDGHGAGMVYRTCLPGFIDSSTPFRITFLLSLLFDSLIFVLTVTRTYHVTRESKRIGVRSQLPRLLMRDGSVYFAVMVVVNLVNFALFVDKELPSSFFPQSTGNNSILSHIISVTMLSRLSLNLHAFVDSTRVVVSRPRPRAHAGLNARTGTDATTHFSRYSTWIARAADDFDLDVTLCSGLDSNVSGSGGAESGTVVEISSIIGLNDEGPNREV